MNTTGTPAPAAPPLSAPSQDDTRTIAYVRDLQQDGRLLLRHVARRPDRPLAVALGDTAAGPLALPALTADPVEIARDPARLQSLAATVDALSRQAAPANASTIRLTGAYLRIEDEDDVSPVAFLRSVKWLRRFIRGIMFSALIAMLLALALLAHVDDGRRATQLLRAAQAEIQATYVELNKLPDTAWVSVRPDSGLPPGALQPVCGGETTPPIGRVPAANAEGARAAALCSTLWEAGLRQDLAFLRLARWNARIGRLVPFSSSLFGADPFADRGASGPREGGHGPSATSPQDNVKVKARDWERTEIRTASVISTLTGFVLPLLMGFIGGCAFVLRRLDQKLSESTLEIRDGLQAILRVLLATILGGLLGAVWSGDEPIQLGGYALTLAAAAFFVGFALEAVFTLIEAMVEGVAGKLKGAATTPATVIAPRPQGNG
jgi:hypothetical protein